MQDMTFVIGPDRAAAEIWERLGDARIPIEAASTFPTKDGRIVRVVVGDDDAPAARDTLTAAGFAPIDQHEVLIADVEPIPGALGRLARSVADTGARLHTLYMAMGDRVVIGADDLDRIRSIV